VDAKSVKRKGVVMRMKDVASDDTATSILADSEFTCDRNTSFAKRIRSLTPAAVSFRSLLAV